MSTTINDYVTKNDIELLKIATKQDFANFETKMIYEMRLMDSHLSRQLTVEVKDTLWKVVPIMFTLMTLVNGIFFIAYKWSN